MKILIINSKGHWTHGWFSSLSDLNFGIEVIKKGGMEVRTTEVENVDQLKTILDGVTSDTLIWPNAYFVNNGENEAVWLNEFIEAQNLPFIGSNVDTLKSVLKKDQCQAILKKHRLAIPKYFISTRENLVEFSVSMAKNDLAFPVVLKPTAESGSIGVYKADNLEEAKEKAAQILKDFPQSDVIVEAFLLSDDITCGYIQLGAEVLLLPTFYIVKSAGGKNSIVNRKHRLRAWDDVDKMQPPIRDTPILKQLESQIPQICKVFDIRGITRIDGRLDRGGTFRAFDVNGLPALCFPDSVIVKQCFTCFPGYDPKEVYEALIYTIIYHALLDYKMEAPIAIRQHNLFSLQSNLVMRRKTMRKENPKITFA